MAFLKMDLVSPIHSWFSRVQSVSNAGDEPSRLMFPKVAKNWPKAKWIDASAKAVELDTLLREQNQKRMKW